MTRGFVAEASIGIAWVHPAQATSKSQALLQAVYDGARVKAPALWPLETANALLVLARRGKLTEAERQEPLSALGKLSVELGHDMASLAFGKLSDLASRYRLSIYDAAYLELALRSKLPPGLQGWPAARGCQALPRKVCVAARWRKASTAVAGGACSCAGLDQPLDSALRRRHRRPVL